MTAIHINAKSGDFADTVLMPGDPLRAQYIAESHLDDARRVTDVRNVLGFTGKYQGKALSVMASGMGIPSASIYCTELITEFGVRRIIRVGSCGTVDPSVKVRDIVIAMGASTDSGVNRTRFGGYDFAAIADFTLLRNAVRAAEKKGVSFHVGNVFSGDLFYAPDTDMFDVMKKFNILGVEMEAAGIYGVAAELGAQALAICTVSNELPSGAELTAEERQTTFDEMIEVALEAAILST